MRLRIESKRVPGGHWRADSRVVNAETGEMLEGVQSVTWKGSVDEPPTAVIEVAFTDAQIELQPDEYKVLLRAARKKKRPGWWGWLKEVLGGR